MSAESLSPPQLKQQGFRSLQCLPSNSKPLDSTVPTTTTHPPMIVSPGCGMPIPCPAPLIDQNGNSDRSDHRKRTSTWRLLMSDFLSGQLRSRSRDTFQEQRNISTTSFRCEGYDLPSTDLVGSLSRLVVFPWTVEQEKHQLRTHARR